MARGSQPPKRAAFLLPTIQSFYQMEELYMEFFASAVDTLKVLVMAIGCGLGAWGIVNLLEGYGADNPASNAHVR